MKFVVLLALIASACAPSVETIARRTPAIAGGYPTPTPGDSHAAAYRELFARVQSWGVTVLEVDDNANAGAASRELRLVQINNSLTVNGKLETLAHEAAHLLQSASVVRDWALSEVAADLVSHRVMRVYGLDNRKVSGLYLAQHKEGFASVRYIEGDLRWAVDVLTGRTAFQGFAR